MHELEERKPICSDDAVCRKNIQVLDVCGSDGCIRGGNLSADMSLG
jgi:hypothetical protein